MSGSSAAHSPNAAGVPRRVETGCRPGDVPWVHGSECRVLGPLFSGGLRSSDPRGTVKLSRICPFCGRILLDQRLRINDLAVAAGGENAAKLLNLTVPGELADPFGTQPVHGRKHVDTSLESAIVQCGQGAQGCGERTLGIPGQPIAC